MQRTNCLISFFSSNCIHWYFTSTCKLSRCLHLLTSKSQVLQFCQSSGVGQAVMIVTYEGLILQESEQKSGEACASLAAQPFTREGVPIRDLYHRTGPQPRVKPNQIATRNYISASPRHVLLTASWTTRGWSDWPERADTMQCARWACVRAWPQWRI